MKLPKLLSIKFVAKIPKFHPDKKLILIDINRMNRVFLYSEADVRRD